MVERIILKTVQKEVKTPKAKRELKCFITTYGYLTTEFKNLCLDEQAILDAVGLAKEAGLDSLASRLKRILGRDYY